jgi:dynein heavy chain
VFVDRLIDSVDTEMIKNQVMGDLVKEFFKESEEFVMADPILYGDYALSNPTDDEAEDPRLYEDLGTFEVIKAKLEKLLEDYGFDHKPMNLVLFNDALDHLTKIHRIIRFQKGCGLLVGFGGSGKQSLTRLATFVAGFDVFTITLIRNYKENDFKEDLRNLFRLVLQKPQTFLFTDGHVAEEGFLELINNILTIGMVPGLFPEEDKDGLISPLEDEMRKQKLPETKEFKWNYFVNKARENLHIILAMSPAGDQLRLRCRNFPGLISNTSVDWFFPWPEDALTAVASNFMGAVELEEDIKSLVTQHLVLVHLSVQKFSIDFKAIYKRNNYSTPKNYLDFINNYVDFLGDKRKLFDALVRRLEGGLTTLKRAEEDTKVLSQELSIKNVEIAKESIVVEQLIVEITAQSAIATEKAEQGAVLQEQLEKESVIIEREEAECKKALEEAIPALEAAKQALDNIQKKDLDECKSMAQPSSAIVDVCSVAFYLYPKCSGNPDWSTIKAQLLGDMQLLGGLKSYDVEKTKAAEAMNGKKRMQKITKDLAKEVTEDKNLQACISYKSKAAGGLFAWCEATLKCYDINKDVEPKKKAAAAMRLKKEQGEKKLAETVAMVD